MTQDIGDNTFHNADNCDCPRCNHERRTIRAYVAAGHTPIVPEPLCLGCVEGWTAFQFNSGTGRIWHQDAKGRRYMCSSAHPPRLDRVPGLKAEIRSLQEIQRRDGVGAAEAIRQQAEERVNGLDQRLGALMQDNDALKRQICDQKFSLDAAEADRDKWLEAFNRSEQFQSGPTTRAETAEALVLFYEQHTAKQANELVTVRRLYEQALDQRDSALTELTDTRRFWQAAKAELKAGGCQCVCHQYPEHAKLQDALEALTWHQEQLRDLKAGQ